VLIGHNWPGPTLVGPAHGLAAHCLEQGSAHGGAGRRRPAHPASPRRQPVGESVEEQHKGGRELIWGRRNRGLTGHGLPTAAALGGRRLEAGGQTLGRCRRPVGREASRGRREA
jgi:hypothetical protein